MGKKSPKALVLAGYGINCDYETFTACKLAGFDPHRVHLKDLLGSGRRIFDYNLIVFPGGFTFGDDLGSGVAFSAKIRYSAGEGGTGLYDYLMEFVNRDGLILGVCNGFQILVRLGIIPAAGGAYGEQQMTLGFNREGTFLNRWVNLEVEKSPNVFTRGLKNVRLPVRHGEGRLIAEEGTLETVEKNEQVPLRYGDGSFKATQRFPWNPNGSQNAIAGLCDPTGRVFGLMPHPEAAVSIYQYPDWTLVRERAKRSGAPLSEEGDGLALFKNAYHYVS